MSSTANTDVKLGISACLLGEEVRYNGGHKRHPFIVEALSQHFQFTPVCPEVEIGLGIPRPPIRLVGTPDAYRVLGVEDASLDVTEKLQTFAHRRCDELLDIDGYILKKDSPSCGMERVKVYHPNGGAGVRKGAGLFARQLMQRFPLLPVEEEGRLNDAALCENFLNRVYIHHRWRRLQQQGLTAAGLVDFHTRHKYLVMAHSQAAYKRMGQLLAHLKGADLERLGETYFEELMTACKRTVTRKRHVNVLQHIMGYLKKTINGEDKVELGNCIEAYRRGETPLVVPVTMLRHYFRVHPDPYIADQVYLNPHPDKLGLRNRL